MRPSELKIYAAELERQVHARGNYGHVSVRSRAGHLNIEVADAEGVKSILARATPLDRGEFGLSFRTHSGRWESMPVSGTLVEIATGLLSLLGSYVDPVNLR